MKRFRLLILLFAFALAVPMGYVVWRTYRGLEQEEAAKLRFFADTVFDQLEAELAALVRREENRAVDEYHHTLTPPEWDSTTGQPQPSPLSQAPPDDYILGYLQNNPDGSFQTPLVADLSDVSGDRADTVARLKQINQAFNRKKFSVAKHDARPPALLAKKQVQTESKGFADKYLDLKRTRAPKDALGQKEQRVEEITISQALNITRERVASDADRRKTYPATGSSVAGRMKAEAESFSEVPTASPSAAPKFYSDVADMEGRGVPPPSARKFQVEVAPLQSVFIDDRQVFIFRRIAINNQVYRQGFVLRIEAFLSQLARMHFSPQPMARFAGLHLSVFHHGRKNAVVRAGAAVPTARIRLERAFPSPFDFLVADLVCDRPPASGARRTLNIILAVLAAVLLIGMATIYRSTRAVVELSERRAQFVSSVTHELKTPLTNIRMYIEMLEQGIARDSEREQEYFQILDSEGARLSRLINNVLELSKLEKKQRIFHRQTGTFDDVLEEVRTVMQPKLRQEGFELRLEKENLTPFPYDREVMVQILINLVENSIKFGRNEPRREIILRVGPRSGGVEIAVADTGPGIPRRALKRVFDDFYRVDDDRTRAAGGTGIGLALVKRFVTAMGGTIVAANNDGPGCTFTIFLPK